MKNHIIISLLILSVGFSQQLIPQITETYDNGNIKTIIYHKKTRDKIEKVKYVQYQWEGYKWLEKNYKDGKQNGLWTEWYENGQKEREGTLKDGELDGPWTWWYFPNGQKEKETPFKDGKQNGLWKIWYKNGQKKEERTYKDGELVDILGSWNEDGSVRKEPFDNEIWE